MPPAIKVENLSKSYLVGHNNAKAEGYTALRDVLSRNARNLVRKTRDMLIGRQIVQGDQVEEFWALKDINFEVQPGDRVGIIGRNGAGKSTLLKILSRITEPTRGRVTINGRIASLLEVGTGFHPELTGRENIFLNGAILGMNRKEIQRKFDEIVDFAEIEKFLDTPVKRYSSGMYVRLAFAVAAHLEPEILVVDEVLAVGDMAFQEKCLGKMEDVSGSGSTVIFVSHNLESIKRLCSTGIYLDHGAVIDQGDINHVVGSYFNRHTNISASSVIKIDEINETQYGIQSIEILSVDGKHESRIKTWDSFIIRVNFHAPERLSAGSVVIRLQSVGGEVLSLLSTQPDQSKQLIFEKGSNVVDCRINNIPLSAGEYLIGAGLAIPNKEWLIQKFEAGVLKIQSADVYNSGLAPVNNRCLLALEAEWL
jgi:lipopolysaccharide transport system ATP-binding protein